MSRKALSLLWKSPRRAGEIEGRRVDFLELFFDLIYVVLIAELAHIVAVEVTAEAFRTFAFLYIMVWFLWLNAALYHNVHGCDDLRTRIFVFIQIGILVFLTVSVPDALGDTSVNFALSYGAFMALLTFLWWRTGVHDPAYRPQTIPYITTYPIAVVLFLISVLVDAPVRFYLWGIALLIVMVLPITVFGLGQRREYFSTIDLASPSLRERYKFFTIIVFGEAIIGVVAGLSAHHHLDMTVGMTGGLGLILVFLLWWLYFDAASDHPVKPEYSWFMVWTIIHLPIWIGITTVGPSVLNIIALEEGEALGEGVRWLLTGAIGMTLASMAVFLQTLEVPNEFKGAYRNGSLLSIGLMIVVLAIGYLGGSLSTIAVLFSLGVLLVIPVLYSQYLQVKFIEVLDIESGE